MTREYIMLEMTIDDLKAISGLIPKEGYEYFTEENLPPIAEQKKAFGMLGNVVRR